MADSSDALVLALPPGSLSETRSRFGETVYRATLPEGTFVDGRDLSGAILCTRCASIDESDGRVLLELPPDTPRIVRVPMQDNGERGCHVTCEVDVADLCTAVSRADAVVSARRAISLLESGRQDEAYGLFATLAGKRVPAGRPALDMRDHVRAYEDAGVLPAFSPSSSANTHSPTEEVPKRFTHVALDRERCVTREFFSSLLDDARSREPQYAGVLEEHSIGYVAKQLREPFAKSRERQVALVNGHAVEFGHEVIPIGSLRVRDNASQEREIFDLGAAAIAVDKLSLMDRFSMGVAEADEVAEWLQRRFEADLATAMGRVSVAHVSSWLRSPEVVKTLVSAGVRLENPETGESMHVVGDELACNLDADVPESPTPDEASSLYDWCCQRISCDDRWRVTQADAVRIATDGTGPMSELRELCRQAYLKDECLTHGERIRAVLTPERIKGILEQQDVPPPVGGIIARPPSRHIPLAQGETRVA